MAKLKNGKFSITYASDVQNLHEVEALTSQIGSEVGFEESIVDDLAIAITELFNNAIFHGNKNDPSKQVELLYTLNNDRLSITVKDEGPGFIPEKIRNPLDPENIMADSGRGLYLVKMLMDSLELRKLKNGSEVIITKKLSK